MIRQFVLCLGSLIAPFGALALAAADVIPIGVAVPVAIVTGLAAAILSTLCGHGLDDARERGLSDVGIFR